MSLTLQMLGTGNAFAKKYFNNNALLSTGSFTLMIDCGITAPYSLHQLGKPLTDIDALLITHIHGDHVGGLEEVAFRMKYVHNKKPLLYIPKLLIEPLWENTLKGGLEQDGISSLEDAFEVFPLDEGSSTLIADGLDIEMIRTPHIPGKNSYSLYINNEIFYSADMIFQPELLTQLVQQRGCRRICHEVQLTGPGEVHTTLHELKSLPEHIQEIIYLMHYGDEKELFEGNTGPMQFLRQYEVYTL